MPDVLLHSALLQQRIFGGHNERATVIQRQSDPFVSTQ